MAQQQDGGAEGDFAYKKIEVESGLLRDDLVPSLFVVQVKSDTDVGQQELNDPIGLYRELIPEMQLGDEEVRAMLLRVNAEVPANPVHRSHVWALYPGSTIAAGIQFKHQ